MGIPLPAFFILASTAVYKTSSTGLTFARNGLCPVLITVPYATAVVLASVDIRTNCLMQVKSSCHGRCDESVQRTLRNTTVVPTYKYPAFDLCFSFTNKGTNWIASFCNARPQGIFIVWSASDRPQYISSSHR